MTKCVAHIVFGLPVEGPFDYSLSEDIAKIIQPGMRVLAVFAGKKRVGYVVGLAGTTQFPHLNAVIKILDETPVFTPEFLQFAADFALHFGCSLGEALELSLPVSLCKSKKLTAEDVGKSETGKRDGKGRTTVLFDQGFKKRFEHLLPRISETLVKGEGVLCLIPDVGYLNDMFPHLKPLVKPEAGVMLRQGTDKEELARWLKVRSGAARLVIGCISGVLAPVSRLGLIVVFEEDSSSYKHDQSPFYHAREAAFLRQKAEGCDVICVTSSPSAELWHKVAEKKAELVMLSDILPPVKVLDLTNFKMRKETALSQPLMFQIEAALKNGGSILLYVPAARGTEAVVKEAAARFPLAKVTAYEKSSAGVPPKSDILVVTQAIFRHRLALRFQLSVVIDIDWEFHKNDHRAAYGAIALVQRLRQMTDGAVFLQTRHVDNEYLHSFSSDDHAGFYQKDLAGRKDMKLPPYAALAALVVRSVDPKLALDEAQRLYDMLLERKLDDVDIFEPQQDRSAIVRGKFRHCVMVRADKLEDLSRFVKDALRDFRRKRDVVVTVNMNP